VSLNGHQHLGPAVSPPIPVTNPSIDALPEIMRWIQVEVMEHTRNGAAARVTQVVSDLTGRQPRSYDDFAREFAGAFVTD
jgi:hypothetical protein